MEQQPRKKSLDLIIGITVTGILLVLALLSNIFDLKQDGGFIDQQLPVLAGLAWLIIFAVSLMLRRMWVGLGCLLGGAIILGYVVWSLSQIT